MRRFALIVAALFLHACGGGSGGGTDTPPANRAPAITSPASVSVAENTTDAFYQATASDPDGNPVTFSLAGPDGFRFAITAAGALSFAAPVDFETPVDADGDNIYRVQLVASDGTLQTTVDLAITVTNVPDTAALRLIGDYDVPVQVAGVPGSSLLFVAQQDGRIFVVDPAAGGPGTLYLTVTDLFSQPASVHGVLGIAAAPDFAVSGFLYVFVTDGAGDYQIRRYGRTAGGVGDPASMDVVFGTIGPQTTYNPGMLKDQLGGAILFGPDNYLYVGIGTSGSSGPPQTRAQDLSVLSGKLLRIDVSRDDFPADPDRDYGIPAGNPFAGGGGAPEIYAYGLRNPRRANFEGATLLIGDADLPTGFPFCCTQRIFMLRTQDAGANFGFGLAEGAPGTTPPVIRYQGGRGGALVTAGYVYRGPNPQLQDRYIFGDATLEQVWSVPAADLAQGMTIELAAFQPEPLLVPPASANSQGAYGFYMDSGNNLFLLTRDYLNAPGSRGSLYAVEYR